MDGKVGTECVGVKETSKRLLKGGVTYFGLTLCAETSGNPRPLKLVKGV